MKAKTIKAVLRKKIDEWLATIEDESVRPLAKANTIITGGCIASMLLREKVNDYDLYFRNKETAQAVAEYYVKRFKVKNRKGIVCPISVEAEGDRIRIVIKSAGVASEEGAEVPYRYFESSPDGVAGGYVSEIMQDPGQIEDAYEETERAALETEDDDRPLYRPVFLSTNAITLSHRIQIIIRFWGEADSIHENYDFVHCTCYWQSWDSKLVLQPAALEAMLARELRYVGSKYPLCSLIRIRKFVARNWTINAGQIVKICMQLNEMDLTNIEVLEDQLTGVDVAYFVELIHKLKADDPEKVNTAYLIEIIDRLF